MYLGNRYNNASGLGAWCAWAAVVATRLDEDNIFLVISTYKEPLQGWIDNLYGPTGVAAGAGSGILRSLHCDGSMIANVVPGDLTINALIACAWDVASRPRYIRII